MTIVITLWLFFIIPCLMALSYITGRSHGMAEVMKMADEVIDASIKKKLKQEFQEKMDQGK